MIYVVFITWMALQTLVIVMACIVVTCVYLFVEGKLQRYYNLWKTKKYIRRKEKSYEEFLQRICKKELHKKEIKKYPLFYWRETCRRENGEVWETCAKSTLKEEVI